MRRFESLVERNKYGIFFVFFFRAQSQSVDRLRMDIEFRARRAQCVY
jgi:hypothetical protein